MKKKKIVLLVETDRKIPPEVFEEAFKEYIGRRKTAEKLYKLLERFDWDAIEGKETKPKKKKSRNTR